MKKRARGGDRAELPRSPHSAAMAVTRHVPRVSHQKILKASKIYPNLVEAYHEKVLSQKTRTVRLLGRKSTSKIIHTLLGYEVQAAYKRIQCPDLVTARYIRLFSELGFHTIQLPYDPTLTAQLIPQFEAAVEDIAKSISELYPRDLPMQHYVTRIVYRIIRQRFRPKVRHPLGKPFEDIQTP